MKKQDKLNYLFDNHLSEYLKTRKDTEYELSNMQTTFCCCGKIASGLHESHCRKFRSKVDDETIKRLNHLIPN